VETLASPWRQALRRVGTNPGRKSGRGCRHESARRLGFSRRARAIAPGTDHVEARSRARASNSPPDPNAFPDLAARFETRHGTSPRRGPYQGDRARSAAEAETARRLVSAAAADLRLDWCRPRRRACRHGLARVSTECPLAVESLEQRLSDHRRCDATALRRSGNFHMQNERRLRAPILIPQLSVNQFDPTLPGPDVIIGLSLTSRFSACAVARSLGRRHSARSPKWPLWSMNGDCTPTCSMPADAPKARMRSCTRFASRFYLP